MTHLTKRRPKWMRDFHAEHGIWPIAGGSDDAPAPGELTIPADEPDGDAPLTETPPAQEGFAQGQDEGSGRSFSAEDIAKARKEEKDKLYGRVESLNDELKRLREAEEERKRMAEEAEARAAEEARQREEEEMDVRSLLQTKEQEWQQRFQQLEEEREAERALLEQERRFQTIQAYRAQRVAEEGDQIMPELHDLVTGSTEEEIEESLASLKDRTSRILGQVAATQQTIRQQMPGPRVTAPAMGPVEQNDSAHKTVTADDIRSMDIQTYMQNRDKLMQAASRKAHDGGLYRS